MKTKRIGNRYYMEVDVNGTPEWREIAYYAGDEYFALGSERDDLGLRWPVPKLEEGEEYLNTVFGGEIVKPR